MSGSDNCPVEAVFSPDDRLSCVLLGGHSGPHSYVAAPDWIVEGVALCPDCGLYLDFCGTPQELQKLIDTHECTAKGQPQ